MTGQTLQQARALYAKGRYGEAEKLTYGIRADQASAAEALELAALAAGNQGRPWDCRALLELAITIAPDQPQLHYNLGVTCQGLADTQGAMLAYAACLRLQPEHADALWNYSDLLRVNEHFPEAIDCLQRLLTLEKKPRPDLYHRLAVAQFGLDQFGAAEHSFERALAGNSVVPVLTRWEYAHLLLTTGQYDAGWQAYNERFAAGQWTAVVCHPFPQPHWQGESLAGKTLLVHGEQGLGDEIMFASILPELVAEAGQLILACQPPLVRLFAASFPGVTVRAHAALTKPASLAGMPAIDYQIAIGSLPRYRRCQRADFEAVKNPYLYCDNKTRNDFERRLQQLTGKHPAVFRVGLMWGSNPGHGVDWGARRAEKKSIDLRRLQRLSSVRPEAVFISLANHQTASQAAAAPQLALLDFQRQLPDLAATAALIDCMDLVITVDTSMAHLAGAMGKPAWVLLMQHADWRWLRDTDRSPWYPGVRLFRQPQADDWQSLLQSVCAEFADFTPEPRNAT